ncbi:MAG TPA: hypothetical protein VGH43_14205 [Jatrophihabitans sp.]|jgi:hypothetical protein
MGRHSAPDEPDLDTAETTEFVPIAVDLAVPHGRHSHPDEDTGEETGEDAFPTVELDILDVQPEQPPTAPDEESDDGRTQKKAAKQAAKSERKQARRESGTRADLRMLRQNGAVRAQALAAVIVSFLLYTIVMVVIGHSDLYLQWVWVPIVASGFLVGLVLDLGHRRANRS